MPSEEHCEQPARGGGAGGPAPSLPEIVDRILAHRSDLSREAVIEMINERVRELEGLIDEDAAALLVAKELGVPLPQAVLPAGRGRLAIKDLVAGLQNVQILARVLKVWSRSPPDGRAMVRLLLGDATSTISAVAWGEKAEEIARLLKPGDCLLITRASVIRYRGELEVKVADNSEVKVVDDPTVPSLESLAERFGVNVHKFHLHEVVVGSGGATLYGVSDGAPSCAIVPGDLGAKLRPGDVLLIQDPRVVTSGAVKRFLLTKLSRIFTLGSSPIDRGGASFGVVDLLEGSEPTRSPLGIRGYHVAVVPSRAGGFLMVLGGLRESLSVLTFSEDAARMLATVKPCSIVEVRGAFATQHGLRLSPYFRLEVRGSGEEATRAETLHRPGSHVSARATIVSAAFRFKILSDGWPLVAAIINVDDGTGWARAITSFPGHVAHLLSADEEAIREGAATGILPATLSYVAEELRGLDVELRGYVSGDRVMAVESIRLLG